MQNFVFHNPTKIIFGRDTVAQIGPETAAWGNKALLVYGQGSIQKNGLLDQVLTALEQAGVTVTEHGGVRSNPVLSHVRKGIAKAKEAGCDVVVAVGGTKGGAKADIVVDDIAFEGPTGAAAAGEAAAGNGATEDAG